MEDVSGRALREAALVPCGDRSPQTVSAFGDDQPRVCKCAVCLYYREVEGQLALVAEDQRIFFSAMYDRLCHAEADLDWLEHRQRAAALGKQ